MAERVHHSAICVADLDRSLRFYRDGLGLELVMDESFEGDWQALFGARTGRLRSVMLGDPQQADAGIVELVEFAGGAQPGDPPPEAPANGFFLLSLFVDLEPALARLDELGYRDVRRIDQPAGPGQTVPMATLRDPDGVLIELIGPAQPSTP